MIRRINRRIKKAVRNNRVLCFVCQDTKIYVLKKEFFKSTEADQKFFFESMDKMMRRLIRRIFEDKNAVSDCFFITTEPLKSGAPVWERHFVAYFLDNDYVIPDLLRSQMDLIDLAAPARSRDANLVLAVAQKIPSYGALRYVA